MRALCVIAFALCAAILANAAEQEFPYWAYVADDEAAIRSGPGRNYYAAENLSLGREVEVYRHEGDWCAIRPPEECFSWVHADDLRIAHDGIGEVLNDKTPCRVGSATSGLRDVIQVRLQQGEQVEVLDAVQVETDSGLEFHCKIAPPSGEFRWIHKDAISREPPESQTIRRRRASAAPTGNDTGDDPSRSDRWGSWVRSRRPPDSGQDNSTDSASDESSQSATQAITLTGANPATSPHERAKHPQSDAGSAADSNVDRKHDDSPLHLDRDASLESRLTAIELELSRLVVEEPTHWNLDPLRQETERALDRATTADERANVRTVQSKIARLEEIRGRSLTLASPSLPSSGSRTPAGSASALAATIAGTATKSDAAGRYDGIGKLTRVVSQRPNAPRYALVNSTNEVVSFVTPAPGVNLQIFEGQYVGIVGQRGYMPELKKPHVTAQRISPMQIGQATAARRR
jgi:hypothetical protein